MRILYVATDQTVPGTTGGSIHVLAVAEGLAALGHEVDVLATPADDARFPSGPVRWHALSPPLGRRQLRIATTDQVVARARAVRAEIIIERYYNFGGEGIRAARMTGVPSMLEVNAPVIDYPGSPKRWLDRALLIEPLRRWRDWQCAAADLIVTPSAAILPPSVPRSKILEIEWGADTERFRPGAGGQPPFARPAQGILAVFAGAFRRWHGAIHLVEAIGRLRRRGRTDISAVMIGAGPELSAARRAAAGAEGIAFTGSVHHDVMPACLAAADVGVAPFDLPAHPPLKLGFYWSPLKIFEYMASGLPVVAPDIPGLRRIVEPDREGILYDASNPDGLSLALERIANDRAARRALGAAARARAVRDYGWDVHCRKLDAAMRAIRRA